MPPTMPQRRTRNCHRGMCCSVTLTMSELMSYFMKIPDTPWLPAAWLITRSCKHNISMNFSKMPKHFAIVKSKGITRGAAQQLITHYINIKYRMSNFNTCCIGMCKTHLLSDGVLMSICRHLVGVEFGRYYGEEVLEHVVGCWMEQRIIVSVWCPAWKLNYSTFKRRRNRFQEGGSGAAAADGWSVIASHLIVETICRKHEDSWKWINVKLQLLQLNQCLWSATALYWNDPENTSCLMTDWLLKSFPLVWPARLNVLSGHMWPSGHSLPLHGLRWRYLTLCRDFLRAV